MGGGGGGGGGGGAGGCCLPDLKRKFFSPLIVLHHSYRCKLLMECLMNSNFILEMKFVKGLQLSSKDLTHKKC